ncbi:mucin-5AC-like [Branchiostoma floridae]|uniref:Mucin-5AC-like n=1 Tax=Branchiostoma floridae TaxID=7739 RepID=A0A9J7MQR0_BRAFL|nr:mucin-5AC-like [Branchiostoma floridae]
MAARLLLTVGLLFLVGRTAATGVFPDDITSPVEAGQEARDTIADEVNKLETLVEMLQELEDPLVDGEEERGVSAELEDPLVDGEEERGVSAELDEDRWVDGTDDNLSTEDVSQEVQDSITDDVKEVMSALEEVETLEEVEQLVRGTSGPRRVCEHQRLSISCPAGQQINIVSALYGRTTRTVCPSGPIRTTNCRSPNSLGRVRTSCQGKSSCSVRASNSVFGDPCVGTGPPPVATGCAGWTRWYDRDNPSATGDWETLGNLRRENPGQICAAPSGIQARVKGSNRPASLAGERFFQFNPLQGIVCRNADQRDRSCQDYEVRFWCP